VPRGPSILGNLPRFFLGSTCRQHMRFRILLSLPDGQLSVLFFVAMTRVLLLREIRTLGANLAETLEGNRA